MGQLLTYLSPFYDGWGLIQDGAVFRAVIGGRSPTVFGSAPVTVGQWTHLALVADMENCPTFYVNGVPVAVIYEPAVYPSNQYTVGADFQGLIDEVRFFWQLELSRR